MCPEQSLRVHTQHVLSSLRTEDNGLSLYQSYPGTYSLCKVRQPGLLGARHTLHTHGFHTCIGSTWLCLQPPVPTSSSTLQRVVFSSPDVSFKMRGFHVASFRSPLSKSLMTIFLPYSQSWKWHGRWGRIGNSCWWIVVLQGMETVCNLSSKKW